MIRKMLSIAALWLLLAVLVFIYTNRTSIPGASPGKRSVRC